MIGEYYVVTQDNGDQYFYVIPTVYNKISEDNPYDPKNGSIVQMYAQFESGEKYESWSCNLKYFTDLTNKTKADTVDIIFYEGDKLLAGQKGTFAASNKREQVAQSAWRNDSELTLILESSKNAVGDKYMIYQCGMFRQFLDSYSPLKLRVGQELKWIYGYRVYSSLGDFSVEIQDGGKGSIKLIDSTQLTGGFSLSATLATLAATSIAFL